MGSTAVEQALVIGVVDCAKLALHSRFLERKGYTVARTPGETCSALVACEDHLADAAIARWGRALAGPKLVLGAEPPADWKDALRVDLPLPLQLEQRLLSLLKPNGKGLDERRFDVVVVDDDATIRAATAQALGALGLDVRGCSGFAELTGALLQARPDFILLDLNLPGISGQSLGNIIRGRNIPTAVFSSVQDAELKQAQEQIGAVAAFSKTASLAVVGRWIRAFLESAR